MTNWTAVFEPVWTVTLLPANATAWERAVESADADLVARDPVDLVAASRFVAECPEPWLAYLAAERSVDEYSSAWPVQRRRAATAASFALHRVKGTRPALDRALRPLGYVSKTVEWFEVDPPRQPYTFRVSITIEQDRDWIGGRGEIIRVANSSKNAHTKLEAIEVRRDVGPATAFIGGLPVRRRTMRVGHQPLLEVLRRQSMTWIGAATIRRRTMRVGPRI